MMNIDKENSTVGAPLAFVVHTPAKKAPLIPVDDEENEEMVLKLQKFAEIPWLNFGTVKVGSSKTVTLTVQNDESTPQEITLEKFPSEKAGFVIDTDSFSGRTVTVPAHGDISVDVTWTPPDRGNQRETMTFKWQGRYRLQAILFGQSSTLTTAKKMSCVAKKRLALKPHNHQTVKDVPAKQDINKRAPLSNRTNGTTSQDEGSKKVALTKPDITLSTSTIKKTKPSTNNAKPAQSKLSLKKKKSSVVSNKYANPVATSRKDASWWLAKVESGFAQWLNYILSPDQDSSTVGSDSSSRRKSIQNFTRARQEAHVRKLACRLFRSSEIEAKVLRIDEEIEGGLLRMRADRDLDNDLGLRDQMIDFLLTYHPVWLRLGLEVVYGTTIAVAHAGDTASIRKFLRQNFLYNDDIGSYFKGSLQKAALLREEMQEAMHRFTLKRFFSLVLFLDVAKQARIHPSDPVLFNKSSTIKSSKQMLATFSSKYLSGEGDILRHLNFLGYSVTYEQNYLEEFDYSIKNVAVDLTDGLRLTRLLEVLTDQREIHCFTSRLRTPASTREQRVFNVQTFLTLANKYGLRSGGLCTAKDIANGHREKTLALLWTIMMNWNIPALINSEDLNNEILRIQRVHGINARRQSQEAQTRLLETHMYTDEKLTKLLTWCKTVCATFGVEVQNFTSSFADGRVLCLLVHYYLPHILPLEDIRTLESWSDLMSEVTERNSKVESKQTGSGWAATFSPTSLHNRKQDDEQSVQHFNYMQVLNVINDLGGVPCLLTPEHAANASEEKLTIAFTSYLCARLLDIRREVNAAETIQFAWRHRNNRRRFLDERSAATAIQTAFRGFVVRSQFKKSRQAAVRFQAIYRGFVQRQAYAKDVAVYRQKCQVVLKLQSAARAVMAQRRYQRMRQASILIQSQFRGFQARESFKSLRAVALRGITRLQAVHRMHGEKRQYQQIQKAATVINRTARGFLVRRRIAALNKAATTVQAFLRGARASIRFKTAIRAIISIQRIVRGYICRKQMQALTQAAVKIQSAFRCYRAVSNLKTQRAAAIAIQAIVRGKSARSAFTNTRLRAIRIQSMWRGHSSRMQFHRIRSAVVALQAFTRGIAARKVFLDSRNAAITIQQVVRGNRVRQMVLKWNTAAIKIQALARGLAARTFVQRTRAAIRVQRAYRVHLAQSAFATSRFAAVAIQKIVRGRQQLGRYKMMHQSAVLIQTFIRQHQAMNHYRKMKKAAVMIQSVFRQMVVRRAFVTQRRAAVRVQSAFRGFQARLVFSATRNATIAIQAVTRGYLARRSYVIARRSAIRIQALYRAASARQVFMTQRASVLLIQSTIRGFLARQHFFQFKESVTVIQAAVRGFQTRRAISQLHRSATQIQKVYRGFRAFKAYSIKQSAVTKIASIFRGFQARMLFQSTVKASVVLQSAARMYSARRLYLSICKATVIVQAFARGIIAQRSFTLTRNATLAMQAMRRGVLARREFAAKRYVASKVGALARGRAVRRAMSALAAMSPYVVASAARSQAIVESNISPGSTVWTKSVASVVIQRAFRAYLLRTFSMAERQARVARAHNVVRGAIHRYRFTRLRRTVVAMQKLVRAKQQARIQAGATVTRIARGFLGRLRAQKWARGIVAIQSAFRGFRVRRTTSKRVAAMRARISQANAAAAEEMRLGNRTNAALSILLKHSQLTVVMKACQSLDVATKFSRVCCERLVDHNAIEVIFRLIKSCNRSKPHRELLGYSLNILLHLMQYPNMMVHLEAAKEGHSILVTQLPQLLEAGALLRSVVRVIGAACNSAVFRQKVKASKTLMTQLNSVASGLARKASKTTKPDQKKDYLKSASMVSNLIKALESAA